MKDTDTKYCKDCKWFKCGFFTFLESGKCQNIEANKKARNIEYLVDGRRMYYADTIRKYICGPEGKFWKKK